ncbi:MAG: DMT family transporter, partial [Ferrovibrionaceae bacterium]
VARLGASGGGAVGALGPAMAALRAIPVLGVRPSGTDWLGSASVTAGVYLASGGPVRWIRPRS